MCRNIFRSLILTSAVLGLFAGLAATVRAAEVTDDAGFFSREAREKADARLAELKKETGKEVRIETVKAVPADKKDAVAKMEKAEKSKFFEKWARDRATAEHVKGIFVLICKEPGHVHVVIDRQTREQGFGVTDEKQLEDKFLAGFRHKEYDKALAEAVETVSQTVKKLHVAHESGYLPGPASSSSSNHATAQPNSYVPRHDERIDHRNPAPAQHAAPSRGLGWMGWLIVIIVIFLGIRMLGALFGGARAGGGYGGGYGPGYGGGYGGGGGMMSNIMGGLFGAMAGNWLYHSFFGGNDHMNPSGSYGGGSTGGYDGGQSDSGTSAGGDDYQGSGGDFDDDQGGGGGGDFGDSGGDSGGGDFGGGDFGGGDYGGGDF